MKRVYPYLLFLCLAGLFFIRDIKGKVYLPLDLIDDGTFYPPKGEKLHNKRLLDMIQIFYPEDVLYNETLKKGEILKWNPYIFSGYPAYASGQSSFFHPIRLLLHYLFDPLTAHEIGLFIHLFLCATFAFIYLRKIGLGRFPSLMGGITWAFCYHNTTSWFEGERALYAGAYLPLVLYFYERAMERRFLFNSIMGGFSLCMCLLSRHLQWGLFCCIFLSFYLIFKIFASYLSETPKNSFSKPLFSFLIIFLFAFGLSAIQMIPTFELIYYSSSQRPPMGFLEIFSHFFQFIKPNELLNRFNSLITFIYPRLTGSPIDYSHIIPYSNFVEFGGYIGLFPLCCTFLSIFYRRNIFTTFYFIVFILSFLMAIDTFVDIPFALFLPGFSKLPRERILFITSFCGSVLSAIGVDALISTRDKRFSKFALRFYILCGVIASLILFGLRRVLPVDWISIKNSAIHIPLLLCLISILIFYINSKINKKLIKFFSFLLVSTDLFFLGFNFNTSAEKKYLDFSNSHLSPLLMENERELFRVVGIQPNTNILLKLQSPEGYQSLYPDFYFKAIAENSPFMVDQVHIFFDMLGKNMMKLLNVKFIIINPLRFDEMKGEWVEVVYSDVCKIYKVKGYLPRAFFVGKVGFADEKWIIEGLRNDLFNPSEVVYFSEPVPSPSNSGDVNSSVKIIEYSPHRISVDVKNDGDGFLILSDLYYPGWKVYVDGREERIYRAYTFLRGVFLKKGEHRVQFLFEPFSYRVGKIITFLFFLITFLFLFFIDRHDFSISTRKEEERTEGMKFSKDDLIAGIIFAFSFLLLSFSIWIWMKNVEEFDKSRWYSRMGFLFKKAGMDEEGKKFLEKAVKFKVPSYEAHHLLGVTYYSEGNLELALKHFEKASSINPNSRSLLDLALVLIEMKRYEEALEPLKKALRIDPLNIDLHTTIANLYNALGRPREAERHLRILRKLSPELR